MTGPTVTVGTGDGLGDGVVVTTFSDTLALTEGLGLGLDVTLTDGLGEGTGVAVTVAEGTGVGSALVGMRLGRKYTYANDATAKAATTGAAMIV